MRALLDFGSSSIIRSHRTPVDLILQFECGFGSDRGLIGMSTKQFTEKNPPENAAQRIEPLKARRAHYKTPEFRDAITDAFHKAKLHALDDQVAAEAKE